MKTSAKTGVPPKAEGTAQAAEVVVQQGLAERTLAKLIPIFNADIEGADTAMADALALLREALREANCDHTLHGVHFWDLSNNSRIIAADGTTIPTNALPPVGSTIAFGGKSYYIASHKEPA